METEKETLEKIDNFINLYNQYHSESKMIFEEQGVKGYALIIDYSFSWDYQGGEVVCFGTLDNILSYLINQENNITTEDKKLNNGWIETAKLAPNKDQDVLFIAVGQIYIGYYISIFDVNNVEIFQFQTGDYAFDANDVKYWQELPEMPE